MSLFKKCSCFTLRKTVLILGAMSLVLSLACCALLFLVTINLQQNAVDEIEVLLDGYTSRHEYPELYHDVLGESSPCPSDTLSTIINLRLEKVKLKHAFGVGVILMFAVASAISTATSVLIIFRSLKDRIFSLFPWIAHVLFAIVESSIALIYYIVEFSEEKSLGAVFIALICCLGGIAMCLISVMVVSKRFSEIPYERVEEKGPTSNLARVYLNPIEPIWTSSTTKLLFDAPQ